LAFSLPWLALLARGWLRRGWIWVAFVVSAVLFPISIAWIQVPAQQAVAALVALLLPPEAIQRYQVLLSLPGLLIASFVQEGAKLLVAMGALWRLRGRRDPQAGVAAGAASGAGYGGLEAFWLFNQIFAAGLTWGTVQLYGPAALLGFGERFFVVPFHIGTAAIATYGYSTGRPGRYLALAIALHTLLNYGAVLAQTGTLSLVATEIWVGVISAASFGYALWLRARAQKG
jgi:uncharacterized membrane protein YhfC